MAFEAFPYDPNDPRNQPPYYGWYSRGTLREDFDPSYHPTGEETKTSKNAYILRRGVPVDIQREDRFTPFNTFAFSPLSQDLLSLDNGILGLLLFVIGKKSPETLAKIMNNYMTSVTKILTSLSDAGKAHPITALNTQTTFAAVAHRFGILSDSGYLKLVDQQRSLLDYYRFLGTVGIAIEGVSTLVEAGASAAEQILPLMKLKALQR